MILSKIAEKVGIKKPSIYAHFANKQEIFTAILDEQFNVLNIFVKDNVLKIASTHSKDTFFCEIFKRVISFITKDPIKKNYWHKIFFHPPAELKEYVLLKHKEFAERFMLGMTNYFEVNKLCVDLSEDERRIVIDSFISYIFGIISLMMYDEELITVKKVDIFWKIFWTGMEAKIN